MKRLTSRMMMNVAGLTTCLSPFLSSCDPFSNKDFAFFTICGVFMGPGESTDAGRNTWDGRREVPESIIKEIVPFLNTTDAIPRIQEVYSGHEELAQPRPTMAVEFTSSGEGERFREGAFDVENFLAQTIRYLEYDERDTVIVTIGNAWMEGEEEIEIRAPFGEAKWGIEDCGFDEEYLWGTDVHPSCLFVGDQTDNQVLYLVYDIDFS